VLSVAALMANPTTASPIMPVMCHVRSLYFPDEMPMPMPTAPATSDGGAVNTNVMVVLNPNDLTTVGKN
jgi:hypothetical protein